MKRVQLPGLSDGLPGLVAELGVIAVQLKQDVGIQ